MGSEPAKSPAWHRPPAVDGGRAPHPKSGWHSIFLPIVLRLSGNQRHLLQRAAAIVLAFGFVVALYRTGEWLLAA